jgi:hypothetical protein
MPAGPFRSRWFRTGRGRDRQARGRCSTMNSRLGRGGLGRGHRRPPGVRAAERAGNGQGLPTTRPALPCQYAWPGSCRMTASSDAAGRWRSTGHTDTLWHIFRRAPALSRKVSQASYAMGPANSWSTREAPVLVCFAYNQRCVMTVERCPVEQLAASVTMATPRTSPGSPPMWPNARGYGG